MTLVSARATLELLAQITPTKTLVTGDNNVGLPRIGLDLSGSDVAYAVRLQAGVGATPTINLITGAVTGAAAGTPQAETATAAGTTTLAGNVAVTVTSAHYPAASKTIQVAVANADTAPAWAAKVRAALAADADIIAAFAVTGATTAIILTELTAGGNDATLNIALANGTPDPGITPAATSANTTAGVPRVVWTDADGADVPDIATIDGLAIIWDSGSGTIIRGAYGESFAATATAPDYLIRATSAGALWTGGAVTITPTIPADLSIVVIGSV